MENNKPNCKECFLNFYDKEDQCRYCLLKPPIKKITDENLILNDCGLGFQV